jgi:hypothetical protein
MPTPWSTEATGVTRARAIERARRLSNVAATLTLQVRGTHPCDSQLSPVNDGS